MNGNAETCSILLTTDRNLLNEKNYRGVSKILFFCFHLDKNKQSSETPESDLNR